LDHIDLMKEGHDIYTSKALDKAVEYGHLKIVQFLIERGMQCTNAIDFAAEHGYFSIVKWLHQHPPVGSDVIENGIPQNPLCTTRSMDSASAIGSLNIVKFLHENRLEGCTEWAMNSACANKHFSVIRFLHENREEGCIFTSIERVKGNNMNIFQWFRDITS